MYGLPPPTTVFCPKLLAAKAAAACVKPPRSGDVAPYLIYPDSDGPLGGLLPAAF